MCARRSTTDIRSAKHTTVALEGKKMFTLFMANLNKFMNEAKEMLSGTKDKKGGGEVKKQQHGHSFALQFSVHYAIIGKHLKLY
jgi:hypothetical protein